MTKGRYNVSVPGGGSNIKEGTNSTNEAELEDQECMDSCLNSSFIRSLSFHDRPRTPRIPPVNKELHKSRYKPLVSASLENIPSKASSDGRSEYSTRSSLGPMRVDKDEITSESNTNFGAASQIDQNQLMADDRLEERYTRFGMRADKLLKQTVAILRSVDKEIAESLTNLVKPESIALESVIENYKKKDEDVKSCSTVFDSSKDFSNEPIYENLQPYVNRTPKDESVIDNYKKKDERITSCSAFSEFSTKPFSEPIYENFQPSNYRTPKDRHVLTPQRLSDMQIQTSLQNANDLLDQSPQQSLRSIKARTTQQSPKNLKPHSSPRSPENLQTRSTQLNPKNILSGSIQETPRNVQTRITHESPKKIPSHSVKQSLSNLTSQSHRSSKNLLAHSLHSLENLEAHFKKPHKDLPAHSQDNLDNLAAKFQQKSKNLPAHSQQSPKNLQAQTKKSSKNLSAHSLVNLEKLQVHFQQNPKNLHTYSQDSLDNLLVDSQKSPKNLQAYSQQNPENMLAHSQKSSKHLLVHSAQETLKSLESLLSLYPGNAQSTNKPDSNDLPPIERSPKKELSSPDNATAEKFLGDFDLPSDHQQFVKIVGALQNRCLEYRKMIQDVDVLVLDESLNFSELSISGMRHLRKQFESLKKNFRDFKELCCKSVVFGPDYLPIDEKVTEVIQSFYLKLLQEENETFMARLEFGLKMAEIYARMLKYETESKKVIIKLEKEILYLKKTSVGFKV